MAIGYLTSEVASINPNHPQFQIEIPGLIGDIGDFSFDYNCPENYGLFYPTAPLINQGQTIAWLRLVHPLFAHLPAYAELENESPETFSNVKDEQKKQAESLRSEVLALGLTATGLEILSDYDIQLAKISYLQAEVNRLPATVQLTHNVEGINLETMLLDDWESPERKQTLASQLAIALSAYARDVAIRYFLGDNVSIFFDISRPDQYSVTEAGDLVLIDTGGESIDDIANDGLWRFFEAFDYYFIDFLTNDSRRQIVNDISAIIDCQSLLNANHASYKLLRQLRRSLAQTTNTST